MNKRDLGAEILEGIREIKRDRSSLVQRQCIQPAPAAEIRKTLGLSQSVFAALLGVSTRTIQDWEQGRRRPRGPANTLLRIAEEFPEVMLRMMASDQAKTG